MFIFNATTNVSRLRPKPNSTLGTSPRAPVQPSAPTDARRCTHAVQSAEYVQRDESIASMPYDRNSLRMFFAGLQRPEPRHATRVATRHALTPLSDHTAPPQTLPCSRLDPRCRAGDRGPMRRHPPKSCRPYRGPPQRAYELLVASGSLHMYLLALRGASCGLHMTERAARAPATHTSPARYGAARPAKYRSAETSPRESS